MAEAWVDRRAPAVDRILDAVGVLVADRGVAGVTMADVASAAQCSRATLYRYFPDRAALDLAYVQREAARVGAAVAAEVARSSEDPVVAGTLAALAHVRSTPALAAWFGAGDAGRTADLAATSEVVAALGLSVTGDAEAGAWLVRVVVSLLTVPGRDAAEERVMIERFVAPVLAPLVVTGGVPSHP